MHVERLLDEDGRWWLEMSWDGAEWDEGDCSWLLLKGKGLVNRVSGSGAEALKLCTNQ